MYFCSYWTGPGFETGVLMAAPSTQIVLIRLKLLSCLVSTPSRLTLLSRNQILIHTGNIFLKISQGGEIFSQCMGSVSSQQYKEIK